MNTYNWKFHADCLLHVFSGNYKGCILTHFRLKSAPLTIYWRSDFNFRYIIIVTYLQFYTYESQDSLGLYKVSPSIKLLNITELFAILL